MGVSNEQSGRHANETPDIETASADYARRFTGPAGDYFLREQKRAVEDVLELSAMGQGSTLSVLDVGGGHGQLVPLFLHHGCALTVHGSAEPALSRVRAAHPEASIGYVTSGVFALPYPDKSIDVVVSVRLVPHIEAWRDLIKELCRVARRSVVIDYPSWISPNALTPLLFRFKKSIEGNTRTYGSFFDRSIAAAFADNGFEVTTVRKQFVVPMFIHRALNGARWLQATERMLAAIGLTRLLGSPVIARADRR
jgi:SAM-dependent methyltransferase